MPPRRASGWTLAGPGLRLRALHVMGHGSARIARALGVREDTIQRLVRHPPARPPAPAGRMTDYRMNLDLITGVFDLLDRHGSARGDHEHAGRAVLLIGDLARIYEGSQDHPFGPYTSPYTCIRRSEILRAWRTLEE